MTECLFEFLKKQDVEYIGNYKLSKRSSIGIGGNCLVAVFPDTEEKFISLIDFFTEKGLPYRIAGAMTNILSSDEDYTGIVVFTTKLNEYTAAENKIIANCGVMLSKLIREAVKLSLGGCEHLFGIPGTLGGAICGNAGAFGSEISDITESVKVYSPAEKKTVILSKDELMFSYRNSIFKSTDHIILSAVLSFDEVVREESEKTMFDTLSKRRSSQPYASKSLGSIFKRKGEIPIARLIDELGLKGLTVGDAEISRKHSGFIINNGNATSSDVKKIIKYIQSEVSAYYGIFPEVEIVIW